jgi:hypothetical protein
LDGRAFPLEAAELPELACAVRGLLVPWVEDLIIMIRLKIGNDFNSWSLNQYKKEKK